MWFFMGMLLVSSLVFLGYVFLSDYLKETQNKMDLKPTGGNI